MAIQNLTQERRGWQETETARWSSLPGQWRVRNGGVLRGAEDRWARALGWFSIGLGVAEVAAPNVVGRLAGVRDHKDAVRALGLREIGHGVGILSRPRPAGWVWSRVGGDAIDLAFLASQLRSNSRDRGKTAAAIVAVSGITLLDVACAQQLTSERARSGVVHVTTSIIVNRSPDECYHFWRDFKNLPRFMRYLETVRSISDRRTHWIANVGGKAIEWDAEITEDQPGKRIDWRSLPGSDVPNSGSVRFEAAPANRGTIVRVEFNFGQPGHALGALAAKLVGREPKDLAYKDLRRFKQVLETGEVITTEGQPAGRSSGATWIDQIAR